MKQKFLLGVSILLVTTFSWFSQAQNQEWPKHHVTGNFEGNDVETTVTLQKTGSYDAGVVRVIHPVAGEVTFDIFGHPDLYGTCYSEEQQREHLWVFTCDSGNGPVCARDFIYVDPQTDKLTHYQEDTLFDGAGEEMLEEDGLVPSCSWEQDLKAQALVTSILEEFAPPFYEQTLSWFADEEREAFDVPVRAISSEILLNTLISISPYRDRNVEFSILVEDDNWRLMMLNSTRLCSAEGVVIAEDKKNKRFHSIYSVSSGCSKAYNFPPIVHQLKEGRLLAEFCVSCEWYGRYALFEWDLNNNHVRRLKSPPLSEN